MLAVPAARTGFLEWALAGLGDVPVDTVSTVLPLPVARTPETAAAQAFVSFLYEARLGLTRSRRRTRRLHSSAPRGEMDS